MCAGRWLIVAIGLLSATGCAGPVRMQVRATPDACRALPGTHAPATLTWIAPTSSREQQRLDARCALVGPPLLVTPPGASHAPPPVTRLIVATWNLHDGRGDVASLLRVLLETGAGLGRPDAVVLLLQEAVRARPPVTTDAPAGTSSPTRDILEALAPRAVHVAYAPNRPTASLPAGSSRADRGTAIVSTLPLSRLQAIELPVERQRRVTLAAVLDGAAHDGTPWRLRIASVHLENRPGARRLWVRAGAARSRQAAALLAGLEVGPWPGVDPASSGDDTLVVGGDFNTWLGRREEALDRMRAAFPAWPAEDQRATMRGWLRLDYLFARLSPQARAIHRRLDDRYGSDHYPVVAAIDFTSRASF